MTDLETILSWFRTGDMPTEEEFKETFSSFRHNYTKIPIAEVDGLQSSLNNKVNVGDIIGGGDFIPLKGTEPTKPLTGVIEINNDSTYFGGFTQTSSMGMGTKEFTFFGDEKIIIADISSDRQRAGELNISQGQLRLGLRNGDIMNSESSNLNLTHTQAKLEVSHTDNGIPQPVKTFILSQNGISTDALNDATGDSMYTRQLVQKEDGTLGYIESRDYVPLNGTPANVFMSGNFNHKGVTFLATNSNNTSTTEFTLNNSLIVERLDTNDSISRRTLQKFYADQIVLDYNGNSVNAVTTQFTHTMQFSSTDDTSGNKNVVFSINGLQMTTLPQGDETFTRQLVQKTDGTVGYEPKTSPKRTSMYNDFTTGTGATITDAIADVVAVFNYSTPPIYKVIHTGTYGLFYILTETGSSAPFVQPNTSTDYLSIQTKTESIFLRNIEKYQLKNATTYMVIKQNSYTKIIEL